MLACPEAFFFDGARNLGFSSGKSVQTAPGCSVRSCAWSNLNLTAKHKGGKEGTGAVVGCEM